MRVVFDTNIFISAIVFPNGKAAEAIYKIIDGSDNLLISREIINETLRVLSEKFSHDKEELSRVAVNMSDISLMINTITELHVLEDEPDNRILECALDGNADLVITGDKAMLKLKVYRGIDIVSLKEYMEMPGK